MWSLNSLGKNPTPSWVWWRCALNETSQDGQTLSVIVRNNNNHSHNESEAAGFLRLAMYAGLFEVLYMCQLIDASQKVSETQDIALVTCHRDDNSNSSSGPYLLRSDSYLSCMKSPWTHKIDFFFNLKINFISMLFSWLDKGCCSWIYFSRFSLGSIIIIFLQWKFWDWLKIFMVRRLF